MCLKRNVFRVWVVDPVVTNNRDLGVESLLEQWDTVGEDSNTSTGSTTPNTEVEEVALQQWKVDAGNALGRLVCWTSNVLLG